MRKKRKTYHFRHPSTKHILYIQKPISKKDMFFFQKRSEVTHTIISACSSVVCLSLSWVLLNCVLSVAVGTAPSGGHQVFNDFNFKQSAYTAWWFQSWEDHVNQLGWLIKAGWKKMKKFSTWWFNGDLPW